MSAYDSGLGCQSQIDSPIPLLIDGEETTMEQGKLAQHGIYIAWENSEPTLPDDTSSVSTSASESLPITLTIHTPHGGPGGIFTSRTSTSSSTGSSISTTSSVSMSTTLESRRRSELPPPTRAATTLSSSTQTSTAPVPTTPVEPSPGFNGLSTAAKAGIGSSAAVAGLSLVAVASVVVIRRRGKKSARVEAATDESSYEKMFQDVFKEEDSPGASELPEDGIVPELTSEGVLAELPGSSPVIRIERGVE